MRRSRRLLPKAATPHRPIRMKSIELVPDAPDGVQWLMTATITGRSHRIPRVRDAQSAVDPGASPEAGAGDAWSPTDDASHNVSRDVSRDVSRNAPQNDGHYAKHIAVPDLSVRHRPVRNDGGKVCPLTVYAVATRPAHLRTVAHAKSQSREDFERTNPGPTAVPEAMSAEDPWAWHAVISRFRFVEHRRAKRRLPGSSPGPSDDLAAPWRPENPAVEPERRIWSRLPVPRPVRASALRMTTPIRSPERTRMRRRTFPCRPWRRKTTNIR